MSIVRVGLAETKDYSGGWDAIFGKGGKPKRAKPAKASAKRKAAKKSGKKKK